MPRRATSTSFGAELGNKQGRGPKPGAPNAGPPTKTFRHFIANLRNSAKAQKALRDAAEDPNSRNFGTAWKVLSDYDDEKPAEKRELSGAIQVSVKLTREGRRRTAG